VLSALVKACRVLLEPDSRGRPSPRELFQFALEVVFDLVEEVVAVVVGLTESVHESQG